MASDVIDYKIIGHDMQAVEVELDPQETVIAEAGTMNWMSEGISFETRMGDGSEAEGGFFGKIMAAGKRAITGESVFLTHFTNEDGGKQHVTFSAAYPGQIVPVDLSANGGRLICQKDAFLCAAKGTKLDIAFTKKLGAGFFGGEGFILQDLSGDGMCFIHACGTVVKKELNNSSMRVDTGCLVGFSGNINYDISMAGGLKTMAFGGEGVFLAELSGTGTVWLQSLPFARLAESIYRHMPSEES